MLELPPVSLERGNVSRATAAEVPATAPGVLFPAGNKIQEHPRSSEIRQKQSTAYRRALLLSVFSGSPKTILSKKRSRLSVLKRIQYCHPVRFRTKTLFRSRLRPDVRCLSQPLDPFADGLDLGFRVVAFGVFGFDHLGRSVLHETFVRQLLEHRGEEAF